MLLPLLEIVINSISVNLVVGVLHPAMIPLVGEDKQVLPLTPEYVISPKSSAFPVVDISM